MDFFLGCNRWRIVAAVAAAAAAAFEEARIFPLLWRQRFPDAHLKIWPSFQLCSNLVNHTRDVHGRLGRFEVHYRSSLPSCAILNRNSPSTNYQHSSGNSPEYSMMVLVLGDNFEFFLHFFIGQESTYFFLFVGVSHELFGKEMMLLPRLMSFSITIFHLCENHKKKLYLCTTSSSSKLFLTWGNNVVLSNSLRECTCTIELADVHQWNKVDFPCCCFVCLYITSFHSFSTAAFTSGINIAWGERSFAHTLDFLRQASLKDRSPELSEPFVTLGFPISIFY